MLIMPMSPRVAAKNATAFSPERFDPIPDWSLEDLKAELDALSSTFDKATIDADHSSDHWPNDAEAFHSSSSQAFRFSWKGLSVTADFGREKTPFRLSAFDSDSDDNETDNLQTSTCSPRRETSSVDNDDFTNEKSSSIAVKGVPLLLQPNEAVGWSLHEFERERLLHVQEEVRRRYHVLETAIEEESQKSAAILEQVDQEAERKHELALRSDKQYQRSIAEKRDLHLSAIQRDHEQWSQVEERRIKREAAAEEARRRDILAQEERERQEKVKAEAEAKRRADAILAEEREHQEEVKAEAEAKQRVNALLTEERRRKEENDKRRKEEAAKAEKERKLDMKEMVPKAENAILQRSASDSRSTSGPRPKISKGAAALELARAEKLTALNRASSVIMADANLKKVLKDTERSFVKVVNQVTGTQEQIRNKSIELMNMLRGPSIHPAFALTTFASKLVYRCENEFLMPPAAAFALGQVVVNVSSQVPEAMEIVLAKLHESCILTVPKYFVFKKSQFENDKAYYKVLGYKEDDGNLETTDNYVSRVNAHVTLYGAIVQAEAVGGMNPHRLKEGWAWCARLLNMTVADRIIASALEAFLKVAGFSLAKAYRNAFEKLMRTIATEFMANLQQQNDPDSRPVLNRLDTYIRTRQYLQEPEGHRIPLTDASSTLM